MVNADGPAAKPHAQSLPIGLQIIAPPFFEVRLLQIARLYVESRVEELGQPVALTAAGAPETWRLAPFD